MTGITLEYRGWGTFALEADRGPRVVIDPCISPLLGWPHARMEHCRGDLFLLTHGHHEHIRDIHRIARRHPAPLVAPPQVVDYLVRKRGMDRSDFSVAHPDAPVEAVGLSVTGRSFPHLEKHDVAGKVGVLAQGKLLRAVATVARNLPSLARTWTVIHDQPEEGPFLAYDIRFEEGPRVFVSCEAFTHLLDPSKVAAWAEGPPIDLAVVGVETGQEEVAAAHTRALSARSVVAAAVHAPFEDFYSRPPVEPSRFLAAGEAGWAFWTAGHCGNFP